MLGILNTLARGEIFVAPPGADLSALDKNIPDRTAQAVMVKTVLLTLNDANLTGNYAVMHAKLSEPFRDAFTPERLKEAFRPFSAQCVDLSIVAAKTPVAIERPAVSDQGVLRLYGYFDTAPRLVFYQLEFVVSEGEWKAIKINVNIKLPDEK